jgi:prepilin-type N-terminal cleavage/methylation domain-containing protein
MNPRTTPSGKHPRKFSALRIRGFTLTEVLIVIVIIVTLATLGFQLSTTLRKRAARVKEVGNLRSIAQMVITYQIDSNRLPGPVNRGIRLPSTVSKTPTERKKWLSTLLIDEDYLPDTDALWKTLTTNPKTEPDVTYLLNSTIDSAPTYFFGKIASGGDLPKPLIALRSNLKESLSGKPAPQDLSQIWLVCNADDENYGSTVAGVVNPIEAGTKSEWGGRHYAYFDGRVEFIPRMKPSIYPSSHSGNYK